MQGGWGGGGVNPSEYVWRLECPGSWLCDPSASAPFGFMVLLSSWLTMQAEAAECPLLLTGMSGVLSPLSPQPLTSLNVWGICACAYVRRPEVMPQKLSTSFFFFF